MKPMECPREEMVALAIECRSQRQIPAELQEHIDVCPVCSDLAVVAAAFDGARQGLVATAELPDAGRVWRQAQLRARQEAIRTAGRPITAAQMVAFGVAMGLLGAYLGATSAGFQSVLVWAQRQWAALDKLAWLTLVASFVADHGPYFAVLAGAVVLVPTAVCWALSRE
ncbi:MAG TPA: hypothetical protein PKJ41_03940 [Bryobacteraceae bacterium]|nr:hypothetical protein [Bryobacteraceae bacterium]HPT26177.1 hypothetical protein [Bryobacteraceae bacterium]